MKKMITALVLGASAMTVPVKAHVVLSETEAKPGAYFFTFLRVGHGCDGEATESLTVDIPTGIYSAKPQPKAGWDVEIIREDLPAPVVGPHGKMLTDRVARVRWSGGSLPDTMVDQFGLLVKLPMSSGPLYFPTAQSCAHGEKRWTMIPPEGAAWGSVPTPAPVVYLKSDEGSQAPHH
ncbi:YcnI family protein [Kordiimonas sp.]|uniref:YcnI family copper-binding membrane protein n=1 Tax=Kordiimonas sp. TaxID=1970157 RepID=UPI003A8D2C79